MGWGGSVHLSIHPRRYIVPKGPLRASTFFWRGSFFFAFFFLDRVGELAAAAAEEKVFWFFLYLFFGGGWGVFGTAAAAGIYLALFLSSSFFLFLSRAGEFGRGIGRGKERRERQYKVYSPTIFFRPRREKKRRTCGEVGRKSIGLFFVFIYFYVLYLYIYII